jgi:hypothetical protein
VGKDARVRDARREAASIAGSAFAAEEVRVLEPSPPAVTDEPWYADDPLEGGALVPVERRGVTSWRQLCADRGDTAMVTFCIERWLGPYRRVEPLPETFAATRSGLHALAEHVLCPLRHRATGRIGLRWTLGGFGTPFFRDGGVDRQVRVERGELVEGDHRAPITTLRAAGEFAGIVPGAPAGVYTPATPGEPDADLRVERSAASALGDWFGFTTSVLEQLRADAVAGDDVSRVQLWPEHFDIAVTLGPDGARANFGGSAGDAQHPEPYLYVGPFEQRSGVFWNEPFGASLGYPALLASRDQRRAALAFFTTGRSLLR